MTRYPRVGGRSILGVEDSRTIGKICCIVIPVILGILAGLWFGIMTLGWVATGLFVLFWFRTTTFWWQCFKYFSRIIGPA